MAGTQPVDSMRRHAGLHPALAAGLLYLAVLLATETLSLGDTPFYVEDILAAGGDPGAPVLWEFGHLLWRPLGWLLLQLAAPLVPAAWHWSAFLTATAVLTAVNWLAAIVVAALSASLVYRVTASTVSAVALALVFTSSNAVLNYGHGGTAYVPGLALLMVSTWLQTGRKRERRATLRAIGAGLCLAGASLLWFPFVLAAPGMVLLPLVPAARLEPGAPPPWARREGWRPALASAAAFVLVLALGYGAGAAAAGVHTAAEARVWVDRSGHGWQQSHKASRIVTGVPRSFLDLGNDGVVLKRYVFHDPFAPVTLFEVWRQAAWKIVAVHLALAGILLGAAASASGRRALVPLIATGVPLVFFAIVLFEPGSAERYMPAFPFLLLATACAWTGPPARAWARTAVLLLAGSILVVNLPSMWRGGAAARGAALARGEALRARLQPGDRVAFLSLRDPLYQFSNSAPFHPANRPGRLPAYHVIETATRWVPVFREEFARMALDVWERNGNVWVTRRVLAERPAPEWEWAEGDDPRIRWDELPRFFHSLEFDAATAGPDGFLRLAASPTNRARLSEIVRDYRPELPR